MATSPYAYRSNGTTESVKASPVTICRPSGEATTRRKIPRWCLPAMLPKAKRARLPISISPAGSRNGTVASTRTPHPAARPHRRIVIVDQPGAPQTAIAVFGLGLPRNTAAVRSRQCDEQCAGRDVLQPHQYEPSREERLHLRSFFAVLLTIVAQDRSLRAPGSHGCDGARSRGNCLTS